MALKNSITITVTDSDIEGLTSNIGSCEMCAVFYSGIGTRDGHLRGKKHTRNLIRRGKENIRIAKLDAEGTIKYHCSACFFVTATKTSYDDHLTSELHQSRTKHFNTYWSHLERHSRNITSAEGSVVVDFGIIDLKNSGNIFKRSITIKNASTCRISLVTILTKSSASLFGTDTSLPIAIAPSQSSVFNLTFTELNRTASYNIENISMNFAMNANSNQIPFIKGIACVVILGDAALLRALAPTEQYSKRKRTSDKFHGKEVVPAPDDEPSIQKVNYKHKLGLNKIPKQLLAKLAQPFAQQEKLPEFQNLKLTVQNYADFFSVLLHAEEYQMNEDIRDFDINGTTLERSGGGNAFFLNVDGLAEKRPSVLYGDKIKLTSADNPNTNAWEGVVRDIEEIKVTLLLDKRFPWIKNSKWDVRFSFSRIHFQRMHDTIKRINHDIKLDGNWTRTMFPFRWEDEDSDEKEGLIGKTFKALKLADRKIQHNKEQHRAVSIILSGVHEDVPFIVFGPPGTGKTSTVIESIYQLARHKSKNVRILATAPSNAAADLICFKLSQHFGPTEMIRFNAPTRSVDLVYPDVAKYCSRLGRKFEVPSLDKVKKFKIIVSTCGASGALYGIGGDTLDFTHIFIDEAGHALEPEAMLALQMAGENCRIILSGDPRQLGPIVRSPLAKKLGFNISYLERLINSADSIPNGGGCYSVSDSATTFSDFYGVLLKKNYRSHPKILEIPNRLFYHNQLIPSADSFITESLLGHPILPNKKFPILFQQVPGKEEREANSPSWFNPLEVQAVKKLVETILEQRGSLKVQPQEIGVIAPYRKQMKKVEKVIGKLPNLTVGTTEIFQGAERKVIIVSTVRSNKEMLSFDKKHSLGFIGDSKRFNVAMTRAQALLCVVGDARVLRVDESWREWLKYVRENGGWKGELVDIEEGDVDEVTMGIGAMNVDDDLDSYFEPEGGDILAE